jgi:cytochrome c peroxidase
MTMNLANELGWGKLAALAVLATMQIGCGTEEPSETNPSISGIGETAAVTTGALHADCDHGAAPPAHVGPFTDVTGDAIGASSTVSANPIALHTSNPFFEDFGTNERTCGTCHQEDLGWTITPDFARSRRHDDPLFVFDGSDCLAAGVPNNQPRANSKEMLSKALVRIELGIPPTADFLLVSAEDRLGCATPPSAALLRMYRRPLPVSNTAFLSTVMWDGRENVNPPNNTPAAMVANLKHQSNDATLIHAQGAADLPDAAQSSIVGFETGIFNAQKRIGPLDLDADGAHGGADYLLSTVLPSFSIGINDVFATTFSSTIFTLYAPWEPGAHRRAPNARAAAIGRGEALFNTRTFAIDNVRGINSADPAVHDPIAGTFNGFCGTCHDTPNVGNHSVSLPIDIGITAASPVGGLDITNLPTYTFQEISTGKTIQVTDPGRGLISGKYKDLGKTKGPILRGLATRAPYFHNGSAKDLKAVVDFYNTRFNIGFTGQEESDLVAFLSAL